MAGTNPRGKGGALYDSHLRVTGHRGNPPCVDVFPGVGSTCFWLIAVKRVSLPRPDACAHPPDATFNLCSAGGAVGASQEHFTRFFFGLFVSKERKELGFKWLQASIQPDCPFLFSPLFSWFEAAAFSKNK